MITPDGRSSSGLTRRYSTASLLNIVGTMLVSAGLLFAPVDGRAQDWRIGALFPLSGNLSVLGTEALAGDQIAVDMVNEQGGVKGHKIILVTADATNPAVATNEARRLVTRENVKLLTGTYGSSISLAIAAVANQFNVPYWEGSAVSDELTSRGYKYVFRMNDNASAMSGGLVEAVTDLFAPKIGKPIKDLKIVMIHEDSAFGTSIAKTFEAQIKQKGGSVTLEPYPAATQDLSPLVLRIKQANPDVLVATQYFNDAILFWRQARNHDYNPRYFVAIGAGQATPDYYKGVGKDGEGVLLADVPSRIKPEALLPEARKMQDEFFKRYEAKMGKPPASHATRHFSAMHTLLTKILPAAGSLEPEAIRKAVLALDEPVGSTILGFGLKFAENGQNERAFNVVLQWQDGKLVSVWPQRFAVAAPVSVPLPDWNKR
jgi:branched-chain amino acid transport system substrate-binding protein